MTDVFAYCERELPNWNTISISGYHIREAGSTAVQEVAFTFANAIAYVQAAIDAGLDVNQFGQRVSFFFNAHNDFLEEVAKFRAARRLWGRIMRERFGATNPRALQLRFHTQTAGSTLTAQQPDNNIVRVALQALAAVLGGTQSLHCNGRDEALGLPTEESARTALRTQQIIAAETGVTNTVDPVGGAWAIEEAHESHRGRGRTHARPDRGGRRNPCRHRAWNDPAGNPGCRLSGPATGRFRSGVVVGVNRYAADGDEGIDVLRIDAEIEQRQKARLQSVRASRDATAWRGALDAVTAAARDGSNLMPPLIRAVESRATVGEISDALRSVFGEHKEIDG